MLAQTFTNNGPKKNKNKNKKKKTTQVAQPKSQVVQPSTAKVKRAHENHPGLLSDYFGYHVNGLADYVYGLYHPEVVYDQHMDIKMPARLPIPTTTFSFKDTFTIAPNADGNFCLIWCPNFLGSDTHLQSPYFDSVYTQNYSFGFSTIVYNNENSLTGNAPNASGWKAHLFKRVNQDFSKYRLTSACLKVRYTGKVLDQSGMIAACASYLPMNRLVAASTNILSDWPVAQSHSQTFMWAGDFDTIRQGQWAKSTSLVSDPDGLTVLYMPSDPLSEVFVDNGQTIDREPTITVEQLVSGYEAAWTPKNANLSFAVCGYGISNSTTAITIESYTNYEIIVTPEQMPYFRPKVLDAGLQLHEDRISRTVRGVTNTAGLVTHTKSHEDRGVMARIRDVFSQGWKNYGDYVPALLKMASLLV